MECPDCKGRLTLNFSDSTNFYGKCVICGAEFEFVLRDRQPELIVKEV